MPARIGRITTKVGLHISVHSNSLSFRHDFNFKLAKYFVARPSTMSERKEEKKQLTAFPFVLNWGPRPQQPGQPILQIAYNHLPRSLPTKIDLRGNCTPIKNQGSLGSCTAFAGCAAMEYIFKFNEQPLSSSGFSELFLVRCCLLFDSTTCTVLLRTSEHRSRSAVLGHWFVQ